RHPAMVGSGSHPLMRFFDSPNFPLTHGGTMNKLSLFKGFAGSFLFSLALSLIFVGAAQAQSGRATVKGLVQDQQGNVVAGATVTLSDQNKNFSRTQTSNQDGAYIFTAIPPGTYRIEVEAAGFKKT